MKILAFAAMTAGLLFAGAGQSSAEVNYPWCIITGGSSEGVYSCGYVSEAQCRQTRLGTDMCVPNPRYQAAPRERIRRDRPG